MIVTNNSFEIYDDRKNRNEFDKLATFSFYKFNIIFFFTLWKKNGDIVLFYVDPVHLFYLLLI